MDFVRLVDKACNITRIWFSITASVIYALCLLIYQGCIKGLEMPAGFSEAVTFLIKHPGDYAGATIIGIVLHAIGIAMVLLTMMTLVGVLFRRREFNIAIVIELLVGIVMIVLNIHFVKYVSLLVLTTAVIFFVIWAFLNADR